MSLIKRARKKLHGPHLRKCTSRFEGRKMKTLTTHFLCFKYLPEFAGKRAHVYAAVSIFIKICPSFVRFANVTHSLVHPLIRFPFILRRDLVSPVTPESQRTEAQFDYRLSAACVVSRRPDSQSYEPIFRDTGEQQLVTRAQIPMMRNF